MTITAAHEAPRPRAGAGFTDAVTVAFGDPAQRLYGLARIGVSEDGASGLAVLFDGVETVTAHAEGGLDGSAHHWDDAAAGGVRHVTVEPLRTWSLRFDDQQGNGFDLRLSATSTPAGTDDSGEAARIGGMTGYEQLCSVEGVVRVAGRDRAVRCLGQRGHAWGAPDWNRLELVRTVSAWLGEGEGVLLTGVRAAGAMPDIEAREAVLVSGGVPARVPEAYLSTTSDAEGRQRRAGIELWTDPERWPQRAAGEVLCGSSLDLGRLRYDCAFFGWRMEGRSGVGRYDVLRRVA